MRVPSSFGLIDSAAEGRFNTIRKTRRGYSTSGLRTTTPCLVTRERATTGPWRRGDRHRPRLQRRQDRHQPPLGRVPRAERRVPATRESHWSNTPLHPTAPGRALACPSRFARATGERQALDRRTKTHWALQKGCLAFADWIRSDSHMPYWASRHLSSGSHCYCGAREHPFTEGSVRRTS